MENGQTHIYYGDGKGKTTAAVGLAARGVDAGKRVYVGQFIKDMEYNEIAILKNLPGVKVELYGSGSGCFIGRTPSEEDFDAAEKGLHQGMAAAKSGEYDIVISAILHIGVTSGIENLI